MPKQVAGVLVFLLLSTSGPRSGLAVPKKTEEPTNPMTHAKEETEAVLNTLIPAATLLLEKNGEMFPIGAAMLSSGKISAVATQMGDEHPSSQKVIDGLNEALRAGARQKLYKATGVAIDMRVLPPGESEKTDALAVRLEHVSGYSVQVILPYRLHDKRITFGKTYSITGTNDVFGSH